MTAIERLSVHYRFSGPALDVDALLAAATPAGAHESWRRGDPLDGGQRARTSGVQVEIGDFEDAGEAVDAIEGFLDNEAPFLAAAARAAGDETLSALAIALWVYEDESAGIGLAPELLQRLSRAGIAVEVTGFPRAD